MGAQFASVHDDSIADWLALRVISLQGRVNIFIAAQTPGKRLSIAAGFGDPKSHVRTCIGCGVADHRDAAEHQ
jgi:hypothetical protein